MLWKTVKNDMIVAQIEELMVCSNVTAVFAFSSDVKNRFLATSDGVYTYRFRFRELDGKSQIKTQTLCMNDTVGEQQTVTFLSVHETLPKRDVITSHDDAADRKLLSSRVARFT